MTEGRLYFRVLERADGTWACRRGRKEIDHHQSRREAVDHMASVAAQHRPSEVVVHYSDGEVERTVRFT